MTRYQHPESSALPLGSSGG